MTLGKAASNSCGVILPPTYSVEIGALLMSADLDENHRSSDGLAT